MEDGGDKKSLETTKTMNITPQRSTSSLLPPAAPKKKQRTVVQKDIMEESLQTRLDTNKGGQ